MGGFSDTIRLEQRSDNSWTAEVPEGWDFMGIPNGGLISSMLATALSEAIGRPDPVTSTAHFLRPASVGPAQIDIQKIRAGRRLTTARAVLTQDQKIVAHLIASMGDLGDGDTERLPLRFEPLPDPEVCVGVNDMPGFEPPAIAKQLGLRLHPDHIGFATGNPSGVAEVSGWVDLPTDDPSSIMALVADALPPAVFNSGLYFGPVPTVELTVHTHARPAPGPVAVRFRTDHIGSSYLEEDGWIADSTGRLVAVSRQLAVLPI